MVYGASMGGRTAERYRADDAEPVVEWKSGGLKDRRQDFPEGV